MPTGDGSRWIAPMLMPSRTVHCLATDAFDGRSVHATLAALGKNRSLRTCGNCSTSLSIRSRSPSLPEPHDGPRVGSGGQVEAARLITGAARGAWCRRRDRRSDGIPGMAGPAFSASTRQRQALIAYLRDHLSGSDMAIRVVHRLGSTHQGTEDGTLFRRLSKEFEEDRSVVQDTADAAGRVRTIDETSCGLRVGHRAERDRRR